MLGFDREKNIVSLGDTADLQAYLYDESDSPIGLDSFLSVQFTIQKPDKTREILDGDLQSDGAGFLRYQPEEAGEYRVVATFEFNDGQKQSTRADFEVFDPFLIEEPQDWSTLSDRERVAAMNNIVTDHVWMHFEDLFDSEDGGPWMKDMTLNIFGPHKIANFIPEAIFDINVYNPPTHFAVDEFAAPAVTPDGSRENPNLTVLVQGTIVAVIRHLMRTYTEQPLPSGGQVTYEDRRDYLQRWGTIYQIEFQHYDHLVKLWKRQFLDLGVRKNLVSSKAGRLLPAPLRTRNIGRGYY